jgi:hypothetical protein
MHSDALFLRFAYFPLRRVLHPPPSSPYTSLPHSQDTKLVHAKASRRGQDAKTALKQSWSLASKQETNALCRLQASARHLSVGRLVAFAGRIRTERIAPGPAYYQHTHADGEGKKEDSGWKHMLDWSVGDVSRWLEYFAQLPQYCAAFSDAGVDGPLLLELDDADLVEMGEPSMLSNVSPLCCAPCF